MEVPSKKRFSAEKHLNNWMIVTGNEDLTKVVLKDINGEQQFSLDSKYPSGRYKVVSDEGIRLVFIYLNSERTGGTQSNG